MKNILPICFLIAVLCTSCQKEFSNEVDGNTGGGGGTGGGGTSLAGCKDCLYYPTCDGTIYTFKDSMPGTPNVTRIDTIRYIKDTTFSGQSFRKIFASSSPTQALFLGCVNGNVRTVTFNATSQGGQTANKIDIYILKYNAPVNTQWTDTLTTSGQQALYKSTLKEKNISYTAGGRTYPDVMHVQTEIGSNVPGIGFFSLLTSDYYFAKGVGLVDYITINNASGDLALKHTLVNYFIP